MTGTSAMSPTLTIAILSSQCLVWLGLQKILESSATVPMVVHPCPGRTSDLLRAERRPDLFILDLGTERDALGTINQIRESAQTSKIMLLGGFEEQERMRDAFAYGVDGVILTVQPPEVVLAAIEALYPSGKNCGQAERNEAVCEGDRRKMSEQNGASETQLPPWPDAVSEREREVIRLVRQGLSNKEIAYRLSIADSTVRHHLTNIFDKVGVPNRQKLLVHAHRLYATSV